MWGVSDKAPEYVYPLLASSVAEVKNPLTLEAKDPKTATAALEMLAAGESYEEVGHKLGLTYSQLVSLKNRHGGSLEKRRAQLANEGFEMVEGARQLALKKMAMLAENPDALAKVSLKDLMLTYAVAQDKSFAALGEVQKVQVEHTSKKPSIEDALRAIHAARAALKKAEPVVAEEGPVVDVEPVKENNEPDMA